MVDLIKLGLVHIITTKRYYYRSSCSKTSIEVYLL
uniref:Uncharacterized protein n=1 Tax=Anguilla anguilla TaxID=7936 RepID=A0A0E9Y2B4_ANGAN